MSRIMASSIRIVLLLLIITTTVNGFAKSPVSVRIYSLQDKTFSTSFTSHRFLPFPSYYKINTQLNIFKRSSSPPASSKPVTKVSDPEIIEESENPLKFAYLGLWFALVIYVFGNIAPPDIDPNYSATMTQKILTTPYDGTVNPIFVAIFNLLGVYPALFASLLLPASKKQSIPAWPFIFGAFALGFFAEGPYLALRKIRTSGSKEFIGAGNRLFDNKIAPVLLFGFSAFLIYFAIFGEFLNGDKIQDFITLFMSQRLVHVSTIDFTILTFVIWDAIKEDMIRRKWEGPSATTFALFPIFGPIAYVFLRPKLPSIE